MDDSLIKKVKRQYFTSRVKVIKEMLYSLFPATELLAKPDTSQCKSKATIAQVFSSYSLAN